MKTVEKEKIREAVRANYGKIANDGGLLTKTSLAGSCCGPRKTSPNEGQGMACCGSKEFDVKSLSTVIGYSQEDLEKAPEGANMGLGCGNPVAIASLKPGETVVDLGCGGGFDCFLAAKQVGETGRVIGVDMTADMISRARKNVESSEFTNVEFRLGEIEHLPVADNSVDVIMSNCVINLSPDKDKVYQDAYRVLRPGGRIAISDIVATGPIPEEVKKSLEMVSACVGGASSIEDVQKMLSRAGFQDIRITTKEISKELIDEWAPGSNAGDYAVSAYIEAVKPV